eukprot:scaffold53545_cov16-Tisochrysis_lutea.AAC.3
MPTPLWQRRCLSVLAEHNPGRHPPETPRRDLGSMTSGKRMVLNSDMMVKDSVASRGLPVK